MASQLPLQSSQREVVDSVAKDLDRRVETSLGIDLQTANVIAAVQLGIAVGEACLRQILRGTSGPLGPRERT